MSELKRTTQLNNTPNVTENVASGAPETLRAHVDRRGCPSSSRGIVRDWWWLRLSAALLVPLNVWFVTALVTRLLGAGQEGLIAWLANPLVMVAMVIMLAATFMHTRLGLHEVVIDYVPAPAARRVAIFFIDFLSLALALASIAAVIQLYRMA